jgi:hypothetical protein
MIGRSIKFNSSQGETCHIKYDVAQLMLKIALE